MRIRCVEILSAAVLAAFAGSLAGCGGGASETPTVTAKPISNLSASQPQGDNGGVKPKPDQNGPPVGGEGSFTGVVKYGGAPPSLPPLVREGDQSAKDAKVCALHGVPDESLVVGKREDGSFGVQNVFVWVSELPAGVSAAPAPEADVPFDQQFCRFKPHCLIVRAGQTVRVLNSDPVLHNTKTTQRRNPVNDISVSPNTTSLENGQPLVYQRSESIPIRVGCDIHNWMKAFHLPLDHGFAALTNEKGEFEIKDLPAGRYQINVWHEEAGFLAEKRTIFVQPDQATTQEFQYPTGNAEFRGPRPRTIFVSATPDDCPCSKNET